MGNTTIIELDNDFVNMLDESSGWFGDMVKRYLRGGQKEVLNPWAGLVKSVTTLHRGEDDMQWEQFKEDNSVSRLKGY